MRDFVQVDVFGDGLGFGNPVAVVLDADDLSSATMQRFAHWTNLSETTFVTRPTQAGADYRVRIFTPEHELPFAGHPTLGTAHAWRSHQTGRLGEQVIQQCAVGLITVRAHEELLSFAAPPLIRSGPLDPATLEQMTSALEIAPEQIIDHAWTDNGAGWGTLHLTDAATVLALPTPPASAISDIGVVGLHADGTPELRAFFAGREDPVTGSLNAGVAQWLVGQGTLTAPYVAHQGTALGRQGRVHVTQSGDGTIWVGGQTRTLVKGTVAL